MYGVAVLGLIGVLYDGIVMWYEGLALVLAYLFYIIGTYRTTTLAKILLKTNVRLTCSHVL